MYLLCIAYQTDYRVSALKHKSGISLLAAKYLLKEGYSPCVCHPAYYSCLQLMKYQIQKVIGKNYEQQDKEIASQNTNSHGYVIRAMKDYIAKTQGKKSALQFDREIKDLKEVREKADYKVDVITHTMATDAIDNAEKLLRTINSI